VRTVTHQVRDLDRHVNALLSPLEGTFNPSADPAIACALLVDHLAIRRNKRCLLAYHRVRVGKLEDLCWLGVDVLEGGRMDEGDDDEGSDRQGQGAGNQSSPSPEEEEYFRAYSDLLAAYKGQWTDVDLTGSLEPPRDLFVDVRVLRDAGEIQTEYGYVHACLSVCLFLLGRMLTAQGDQLDQEQPVVCEAWGRGEADCAGVFGAIDLILFCYIYCT
jgi:GINS complex subunit 1